MRHLQIQPDRFAFLKALLPCLLMVTPAWSADLAKLQAELATRQASRDQAVERLEEARKSQEKQEEQIVSLTASIAAKKTEIENLMSATGAKEGDATDPVDLEAAVSVDKTALPNNFVADVTPYVVVIEGDKGSGTGFLCVSEGQVWVYTAAHVLSGNSKITVRDHQNRTYKEFEFLECAEGVDLVRLKPKSGDLRGLELTPPDEAPKVGDVIVAVGNSLGAGALSGEAGKVTNIEEEMWEVDAEIIPGNSGGPVLALDSKKVAGIVTHLIIKRPTAEEALSKKTEIKRFAARLDKKREWRRMPITRFVKEWKYIEQMNRDTSVAWASSYLMHARSGNESMDKGLVNIAEEITNSEREHIHVLRMDDWIKEFRKATKVNRGQMIDKGNAILKQIFADIRLKGNEPKPEDFSWYHREPYEDQRKWRIKMTED